MKLGDNAAICVAYKLSQGGGAAASSDIICHLAGPENGAFRWIPQVLNKAGIWGFQAKPCMPIEPLTDALPLTGTTIVPGKIRRIDCGCMHKFVD
jgi:hypothetical protein